MKNDDLSECIRLFREWVLDKKESTVKEIQTILEKTSMDNVAVWVDYVRQQGFEPHMVFASYPSKSEFSLRLGKSPILSEGLIS